MNIYVLILVLIAHNTVSTKVTYKNYRVYNVIPKNYDDLRTLRDLEGNVKVDYWTENFDIGHTVKIMVSPDEQEAFLKYFAKFNMETVEVIGDVQKLIDDQLRPAKGARNMERFGWARYYSIEEIYAWFDQLEIDYPNIVTVVTMGPTNEGREIKGVKIDFRPDGRETTLIGMYEGGIHAREWISPATLTWIIHEFLTSVNSEVRFLAEAFVWHIFPVSNPDGYSYTFTDNRMWRKNRNTENFKTCPIANDDMSNGVDLNRNFGFLWMLTGASDDSCSNTYAGPSAFSEPETRAIANYVNTLKQQGELVYYIAFHSYTQLILVPYSHLNGTDDDQTENFGDLFTMATRAAEKVEERYGTTYRVGASPNVMYPMSGTSFDWVKGAAQVPISLLVELRDLGEFGFLLPPEQIVPTAQEFLDGLLEIDLAARELEYYSGANFMISSILLTVISLVIVALVP